MRQSGRGQTLENPSDRIFHWVYGSISGILLGVESYKVPPRYNFYFPSEDSYAPEHEIGRHRCGRRTGRLR
jgi:hypothetical protein